MAFITHLGVEKKIFFYNLPVMYLLGLFRKRSSTRIRAPQSLLCRIHLQASDKKKSVYIIRVHVVKNCGNQMRNCKESACWSMQKHIESAFLLLQLKKYIINAKTTLPEYIVET